MVHFDFPVKRQKCFNFRQTSTRSRKFLKTWKSWFESTTIDRIIHRIYKWLVGAARSSYRDRLSARNFRRNVGRLVVTARNIYSKNYGSCISVHSSRQVPRRCIGGSYARDAVRYVKAEHVNESTRALLFFFSFFCEQVVYEGKKQSECAYIFCLINFIRCYRCCTSKLTSREKNNEVFRRDHRFQ